MGNKIVAEFAERLRLSTFGTTLCAQTATTPPSFPQINQFPGVARAFVLFDGTKRALNTPCTIIRSTNVNQVLYIGPGRYQIEFASGLFNNTNYVTTGSIYRNSLSGASIFNVVGPRAGGQLPALTSIQIQTLVIADSAIPRDCDGGNFLFFA